MVHRSISVYELYESNEGRYRREMTDDQVAAEEFAVQAQRHHRKITAQKTKAENAEKARTGKALSSHQEVQRIARRGYNSTTTADTLDLLCKEKEDAEVKRKVEASRWAVLGELEALSSSKARSRGALSSEKPPARAFLSAPRGTYTMKRRGYAVL